MCEDVSVIIPVYNRASRMLNDAIESVLNQTVSVKEIIVVDDGSVVPVGPIASQGNINLNVIRQENAGIGAARNTGIRACKGSFIAFLDSDDIWVLDKIEKQMRAFHTDAELDAVYGKAQQFYDTDTDDVFRQTHPILNPIIDAQISTALLIRKEDFLKVGEYSENHGSSVDIEWELRSRDFGLRSMILPDIVYHRRIHHGNSGVVDRAGGNRSRIAVIKELMDRRRKQATLNKPQK